jgi:hypothetical protein
MLCHKKTGGCSHLPTVAHLVVATEVVSDNDRRNPAPVPRCHQKLHKDLTGNETDSQVKRMFPVAV